MGLVVVTVYNMFRISSVVGILTRHRYRLQQSRICSCHLFLNEVLHEGYALICCSDVFTHCARGLKQMGDAQVSYELIVEQQALQYFQQLLDVCVKY